MYHRIVVPLDGSAFGNYAIRFATEIASRTGADLELVHVHVPQHLEAELFTITPYQFEHIREIDAAVDHESLRREADQLEQRANRIARETGLAVSWRMLAGRIDTALEHEAEAIDADLIVMATHARSGYALLRRGSVADALVRQAKMPVLLVRPPDEPADAMPACMFRNVLVPLDGSRFSEQAIRPAADFARVFGANLCLLHIESPRDRLFSGNYHEADPTALVDGGEQYLQQVGAEFQSLLQEARLVTMVTRSPAAAIVEAAPRLGADVIVMATHGRGGLTRLIAGSTASEVLRRTRLPVLLHRPGPHAEPGVAAEALVSRAQ